MEDIEQVYDLTRIKNEYTTSHPSASADSDTHGGELKMYIELPWGEEHIYGWPEDELIGGKFEKLCNGYDIDTNEFETLQGREIWLMLRYIEMDDGEIDTGSRMSYSNVTGQPSDSTGSQRSVTKEVLTIAAVGIIVALFLLLVL